MAKGINKVEVRGKTVVVRVDLNSPLDSETGKVVVNPRIKKHSETIKELSERGAKVVVLSHQGKKGKPDFRSLEEHLKLLKELTGKKIEFRRKMMNEETAEKIKGLQDGEIILLENVRYLDEETKRPYNAEFISWLSPLADYFVLDALSVAHREHASVVGFSGLIPGFMGKVLQGEIKALEKVGTEGKTTFVMGGAKVEDSLKIMEHWLGRENLDRILLGGCPGILFTKALGRNIGASEGYLERIEANQHLGKAKEMYEKYKDKIEVPEDFGVEENGERKEYDAGAEFEGDIKDIGPKTSEKYSRIIHESEVVVVNGPMGVYEDNKFAEGTREVLLAVADSKAFSLIGGGHTVTAIAKFGIREDNFGYISLSGKAFLQHLSGKKLPGLVAMEK